MSAILNGIRDRIKDRHPDSFSFREYDVDEKSPALFLSGSSTSLASFAPHVKTYYEYSWGWNLTTSQVTCTLSLSAEDVVSDDLTVSMWVKDDQIAWHHNGLRISPEFNTDNIGRLQSVSFRKDDRKHPDGLMALLNNVLEASAA